MYFPKVTNMERFLKGKYIYIQKSFEMIKHTLVAFIHYSDFYFKIIIGRRGGGGGGAWVAQSVKHHDLMVCELESRIGLSAVSTEPTSNASSPSLSAPLLLSLSPKNKQ